MDICGLNAPEYAAFIQHQTAPVYCILYIDDFCGTGRRLFNTHASNARPNKRARLIRRDETFRFVL